MLSIALYHDYNTTHLGHMGVLGYYAQVYGLFTKGVASTHLIVLMMVWPRWVYRLSIEDAGFDIYLLQKHHVEFVSRKACSKTII